MKDYVAIECVSAREILDSDDSNTIIYERPIQRGDLGKAMKENPESDMWKICGGKLSNANGQTAFKAKDAAAKKVVKEYLGYLAQGVVNIVNIFQPEIVCIGGGVSHEGKRLLAPIEKEIKDKSFARFGKVKKNSVYVLFCLGNRHTRNCICLMYGTRHFFSAGRNENGPAYVSARTYNKIGLEFIDYPLCSFRRGERKPSSLNIFRR